MKKYLTVLLILFVICINAQPFEEDPHVLNNELTFKLDSLRIPYKSMEADYINAQNKIVDGLNALILIGKYDKKTVDTHVAMINASQQKYSLPNDITTEKRAVELIDVIRSATIHSIVGEKARLIADYLSKQIEEEDRRYGQLVLKFLRETQYSASEFKKLPPEERERLLNEFEKKSKK